MKRVLLLALFLPLLPACSRSPAADGEAAPSAGSPEAAAATLDHGVLHANHWRLDHASDPQGMRIDALVLRPKQPVTLDFHDDQVRISNTCNAMSGPYRIEGDVLMIGPLAATRRLCADSGLMKLDGMLAAKLQQPLQLEALDAGAMKLLTADGDRLEFVGEPTAQTRYGRPGETLFLEVAAQTQPCSSGAMAEAQCLQVRQLRYDENGLRQGEPGAFGHFHGRIEGYTHQPGTRPVLRVQRFEVADPPADGPSQALVLDTVVESETAG